MTPDRERVEFRSNSGLVPGRAYVLDPMDALSLIRRAAQLRLPVRSVAGLVVRSGEMIRSMDHAVDFSTAAASDDGSWTAAEQFVVDRQAFVDVFEVTLGGHLDHAV
jgi:hypothetical protein